MIRCEDNIFEDYFIDPVTALITDKNGIVQKTNVYKNGRKYFKGYAVFRIMMHTYKGYVPNLDIHHIDKDKTNDALSNLTYMTKEEHSKLHSKGRSSGADNHAYGKHWQLTEEQRHHQSEAQKKIYANLSEEEKQKRRDNVKGWHHTEETKQLLREKSLKNCAMKGKHLSEEQKRRITDFNKGQKVWNNGEVCIRARECPGEGWTRGFLHHSKANLY